MSCIALLNFRSQKVPTAKLESTRQPKDQSLILESNSLIPRDAKSSASQHLGALGEALHGIQKVSGFAAWWRRLFNDMARVYCGQRVAIAPGPGPVYGRRRKCPSGPQPTEEERQEILEELQDQKEELENMKLEEENRLEQLKQLKEEELRMFTKQRFLLRQMRERRKALEKNETFNFDWMEDSPSDIIDSFEETFGVASSATRSEAPFNGLIKKILDYSNLDNRNGFDHQRRTKRDANSQHGDTLHYTNNAWVDIHGKCGALLTVAICICMFLCTGYVLIHLNCCRCMTLAELIGGFRTEAQPQQQQQQRPIIRRKAKKSTTGRKSGGEEGMTKEQQEAWAGKEEGRAGRSGRLRPRRN